jgi:hypothetical protein
MKYSVNILIGSQKGAEFGIDEFSNTSYIEIPRIYPYAGSLSDAIT